MNSISLISQWLNGEAAILSVDERLQQVKSRHQSERRFRYITHDDHISTAMSSSLQDSLSDPSCRLLIRYGQTDLLPLLSLRHSIVNLFCFRLFTLPTCEVANVATILDENHFAEIVREDSKKSTILEAMVSRDPLIGEMQICIPVEEASVVGAICQGDRIDAAVCITRLQQMYILRTERIGVSDFVQLLVMALSEWREQHVEAEVPGEDRAVVLVCNGQDHIASEAAQTVGMVEHEQGDLCDEHGAFLCVNTEPFSPAAGSSDTGGHGITDAFLLLGQSNMSGRGRAQDLLSHHNSCTEETVYSDCFSIQDEPSACQNGSVPTVGLSDRYGPHVRYYNVAERAWCEIR